MTFLRLQECYDRTDLLSMTITGPPAVVLSSRDRSLREPSVQRSEMNRYGTWYGCTFAFITSSILVNIV